MAYPIPVAKLYFNLHELPYPAQKKLVGRMSGIEKLVYSLISKNAKKLVKIQDKTDKTVDEICIRMDDNKLRVSFNKEANIPELLFDFSKTPLTVETNENNGYNFRLNGGIEWNFKEWLEHISEVFSCKKILAVFQPIWFNIEDLKEVFGEFPIYHLMILDYSEDLTQSILENFNGMKELTIGRIKDKELDNEVFTRDYEYLCVINSRMRMEDILKLRAARIEMHYVGDLNAASSNAFIKSWINGWNPRLKTLAFRAVTDFEPYMSGIHFKSCSINEEKGYMESFQGPLWKFVDSTKAIYEIENKDRKKAKIVFDRYGKSYRFKIIVLD